MKEFLFCLFALLACSPLAQSQEPSSDVKLILSAVKKLDDKVSALTTEVTAIKTEVNDLRFQHGKLEVRVTELEDAKITAKQKADDARAAEEKKAIRERDAETPAERLRREAGITPTALTTVTDIWGNTRQVPTSTMGEVQSFGSPIMMMRSSGGAGGCGSSGSSMMRGGRRAGGG